MVWTQLNLTTMNRASLIHLARIAKYFPRVIVDDQTDLDWCRKYMDRLTPIHYTHVSERVDAASLRKWADFRITSIYVRWHSHYLGGVFSYLDHLVDLSWKTFTAEEATVIFKFAASSPSLLHLNLTYNGDRPCCITTSMANDLLQWIASRQIRDIRIVSFTWEAPSLRHKVVATALEKRSMDRFQISETDPSTLKFTGVYNKSETILNTRFECFVEIHGDNLDEDVKREILAPFQALLETKLNVWVIEVWGKVGFGVVSTIVLPLLQESRVQVLKIKDPALTLENIVEIAEGIQGHPTVRELIVSGDTLPFPWAKYLIQSVPRELRKVTLSLRAKYSTREHEIDY
ncbi:hypothetical protein AC1031_011379 [Aphanomyces cochlioides]|nr:hypothetical protein AC1031_011379 [Aphanomyces cochlioides]